MTRYEVRVWYNGHDKIIVSADDEGDAYDEAEQRLADEKWPGMGFDYEVVEVSDEPD